MVKIASEVYDKEEITLQDGTDIELKPLVLGRLRRFYKTFKKTENGDLDELETMDVLGECAAVCLEKELADKVDGKTKGTGGKQFSDEYMEYIEDTLDMETIFKVLEVCGGVNLNNPNLVAAMQAAQQTEAGTP